jgi:hypothetical protein
MTNIPAGWYPDPSGGQGQRWWDGTQWTDHLSAPAAAAAAYPATAAYSTAPLTAPEGTATNTAWIWLIIVLPLLPLLGLLTVDWRSLFDFASYSSGNSSDLLRAEFAIFLSPGYLGAAIGGWIVYGLNAFFAYRDWRFLQRAGVPRPFHFAWVFLSYIVYSIGRAVVVKRRTGHGSAVLWASIAAIVLYFVVSGVMMAQIFAAIFSQIPTSYT